MSRTSRPDAVRSARRLRATAAALLLSTASSAALAQSCDCSDVTDLINRVCEARAAIAEYTRQISLIRRFESEKGRPEKFTENSYKQSVQPCVQEAINQVTNPNARRVGAETNNGCEIEYPKAPATACMRETLGAHESVHVTSCRAAVDKRASGGVIAEFLGNFSDWRSAGSLIDAANDERTAYSTEINHATAELARLARSGRCANALQPPAGPRDPSFNLCPAPRPRPPPDQSECRHR